MSDRGYSSMVERLPSKQRTGVRFPLPAPALVERPVWNADALRAFEKLAKSGLTARQISVELAAHGVTVSRNAVIGAGHRYGIELKNKPRRGHPSQQKKVKKAKPIPPARFPRFRVDSFPAPTIDDSKIPLEQRKTLFQLGNCTCRWIVGDTNRDYFFCGGPGADLAAGRPYCPAHAARSVRRA